MTERRAKVQDILDRVHPKLRRHLNLDEDFLIDLKAIRPKVITNALHDEINAIPIHRGRIDRLVDIIKLKPAGVYFSFMKVLEGKDDELYCEVKAIQDEYFPEYVQVEDTDEPAPKRVRRSRPVASQKPALLPSSYSARVPDTSSARIAYSPREDHHSSSPGLPPTYQFTLFPHVESFSLSPGYSGNGANGHDELTFAQMPSFFQGLSWKKL